MKDPKWLELIELIFGTGNRVPFPMEMRNRGIYAKKPRKDGSLGGSLSLLHSSEHQLSFDTEEVLVIGACQHIMKAEEIYAQCSICGGFTCNREGCLIEDELHNIFICRSDAVKIWRIYTSKLAQNTDELCWLKGMFLSFLKRKEPKQIAEKTNSLRINEGR